MVMVVVRIGNYFIGEHGPLPKADYNILDLKPMKSISDAAVFIVEKGYFYAPPKTNNRIYSPEKIPQWVFPVENTNDPKFLQIGKNALFLTKGVYFIDDEFGEGYRNTHWIKKVGDNLYRIKILSMWKRWTPFGSIKGEYYTDGTRLWSKEYGKNLGKCTEKCLELAMTHDFVSVLQSEKILYRDGSDLVLASIDEGQQLMRHRDIFKRVKLNYFGEPVYVPKYFLDRIIWGA